MTHQREAVERIENLPEAPWVTEMRQHFAEHGFYRTEDLHRLLGEPWRSAHIGPDGKVVMK